MLVRRHLLPRVKAALADRPVVLLDGARQVGKTTLARSLATCEGPERRYLTLDDAATLAAAAGDPAGFIAGLDGPVVLDEVQRVPELFLSIKAAVDRERTPGRYLLTGSADVLLLPRLGDSLAGRIEILTLWPLSQGEIEGVREAFVDTIFGASLPARVARAADTRTDVAERIARGGFPEVALGGPTFRRRDWFGSFLTTVLQRDVRDIAQIEGLTALPRLLALLAAQTTGLLNHADLARGSGLAQTTLKRYLVLLETTFLVALLPAWFVNVGKRLIKSAKMSLTDTGVAAHLRGLDDSGLRRGSDQLGPLFENFVFMELVKQAGWSTTRPAFFHFRASHGPEVDIVLESPQGKIVGIEVKAAATATAADFKGLRLLTEAAGKRFHRGLVLYTGTEVVPFGPNLHAVPLPALWKWGAS
jgi:predicted AAA+ superfamily ATPase